MAGAAMYAVLAAVALAQGRGWLYPAYAVEAMMTGRRVLPDHPVPTLYGRQPADLVLGPVLFLLPAVLVALAVSWWVGRRPRHSVGPSDAGRSRVRPHAVLAPAGVLTAGMFVVVVLLLGFHESSSAVQRLSSGYGVRQLGVAAWLAAHVLYVPVLAVALPRSLDVVRRARKRNRHPSVRMRGDSPAG
jgi:hypothetical protein